MTPSLPASILLASGGGAFGIDDLEPMFWGFVNPAQPDGLGLLFLYTGGALTISFLCSLLEATLLSVRVTELIRRADDEPGVAKLLEYKREKVEEGIGAILTLNTVAHTIGASLAGAQAAYVFTSKDLAADVAVAGFSAILTVAVLVATEIIPKTLGTNNASRLAPFVGNTIHVLARGLSPILWVTGKLSSLLSHGEPEGISRGELEALVNIAQQDGAIADDESQVLSNMLQFEALSVADVMTPSTVIAMVPKDATVADFVEQPKLHHYSRLPVYSGTPNEVEGYVHQRELLLAAAKAGRTDLPVTDFLRPIVTLQADAPLGAALRTFLDSGEHVAIATDAFGGTSGLVTLEDVIETILGTEIVDEADRHVDLRQVAAEMLQKRLAKRRKAEQAPS